MYDTRPHLIKVINANLRR